MHRISFIGNNIYYYKTAKFAATHYFLTLLAFSQSSLGRPFWSSFLRYLRQ